MNKIALVVLDGLGIRKEKQFNAVKNAKMPYFNSLFKSYSNTLIKTYGSYVGLSNNQFGNSEVGHLNLGAGRVVKQNSTRITENIKNGDFFNNKTLITLINKLKNNNSYLHLFGLCSNGGVHSELNHLYAILKLCKQQKFKNVLIHFITDGRDTDITSGKNYYEELNKKIETLGVGKIVSLTGRFYAMDREKNYNRTESFYNVLTGFESENCFNNFNEAFNFYYENNITDEFIKPSILNGEKYKLNKNDAVLCFNFRSDRVRQIFELLIKNKHKNLYSFIEYDKDFTKFVKVIFPEVSSKNCLSEVLARYNKTQLRISETTKYAHVTYFFNLLREEPFNLEDRIIINSEKTDDFSKTPKMKAGEITETVIEETNKKLYDFILINYSNADMIGHTGDYNATIKSLEFLDVCLEKLCEDLIKKGYIILVTADHGNADKMMNENNTICTTHTKSDAPFIIISNKKYELIKNGKLANVSPTILNLFNIKPPKEFTENSLIKHI